MPIKGLLYPLTLFVIWLLLLNISHSEILPLIRQGGYDECQQMNPDVKNTSCTSSLRCSMAGDPVDCDEHITCDGCKIRKNKATVECQWTYPSCNSDDCVFISSAENCPALDEKMSECCGYICTSTRYRIGTRLSPDDFAQSSCYEPPQRVSPCTYEQVDLNVQCYANSMVVECTEEQLANAPNPKWDLKPLVDKCRYRQGCVHHSEPREISCHCTACGEPVYRGACIATFLPSDTDYVVDPSVCREYEHINDDDNDGEVEFEPMMSDYHQYHHQDHHSSTASIPFHVMFSSQMVNSGDDITQQERGEVVSKCECEQICSLKTTPLTIGQPLVDYYERYGHDKLGPCSETNYYEPPQNTCQNDVLYRNIYCSLDNIIQPHEVCITSQSQPQPVDEGNAITRAHVSTDTTTDTAIVTSTGIKTEADATHDNTSTDNNSNSNSNSNSSNSSSNPNPHTLGTTPTIYSDTMPYTAPDEGCDYALLCKSTKSQEEGEDPTYVPCENLCFDRCGGDYDATQQCFKGDVCHKSPITGLLECEKYEPQAATVVNCDVINRDYSSARKQYIEQIQNDPTITNADATLQRPYQFQTKWSCPCEELCYSSDIGEQQLDIQKDLISCAYTIDQEHSTVDGGAFQPVKQDQPSCLDIFTRRIAFISSRLLQFIDSTDPTTNGDVIAQYIKQYTPITLDQCKKNPSHCKMTTKTPISHVFATQCKIQYGCAPLSSTSNPSPEFTPEEECTDNMQDPNPAFPECKPDTDSCGTTLRRNVYCYLDSRESSLFIATVNEVLDHAGASHAIQPVVDQLHGMCEANAPSQQQFCGCNPRYLCALLGTSRRPSNEWYSFVGDCSKTTQDDDDSTCHTCVDQKPMRKRELFCRNEKKEFSHVTPSSGSTTPLRSACDKLPVPQLLTSCADIFQCTSEWKCARHTAQVVRTANSTTPELLHVIPVPHDEADDMMDGSDITAQQSSMGSSLSSLTYLPNSIPTTTTSSSSTTTTSTNTDHGTGLPFPLPIKRLTLYDASCVGDTQFSPYCYNYHSSQALFTLSTCTGQGYRLRDRQCVRYLVNTRANITTEIMDGPIEQASCLGASNQDDPMVQKVFDPCTQYDGCKCTNTINTGPKCDIPPTITSISWLYRALDAKWRRTHPTLVDTTTVPSRAYVEKQMPDAFTTPPSYRVGRTIYIYWTYTGHLENEIYISLISGSRTNPTNLFAFPLTRVRATSQYAAITIPTTFTDFNDDLFYFQFTIGTFEIVMQDHPVHIYPQHPRCLNSTCFSENLESESHDEACLPPPAPGYTSGTCRCVDRGEGNGTFDPTCRFLSECQGDPVEEGEVIIIDDKDLPRTTCSYGGFYDWIPSTVSATTSMSSTPRHTPIASLQSRTSPQTQSGYVCDEECTCPSHRTPSSYCIDCNRTCNASKEAGILDQQRCECLCFTGFTGENCEACAAYGSLTFRNIDSGFLHLLTRDGYPDGSSAFITTTSSDMITNADNDRKEIHPLIKLQSTIQTYLSVFFGVPPSNINIHPDSLRYNLNKSEITLLLELSAACETEQELELIGGGRTGITKISIFTLFDRWKGLMAALPSIKPLRNNSLSLSADGVITTLQNKSNDLHEDDSLQHDNRHQQQVYQQGHLPEMPVVSTLQKSTDSLPPKYETFFHHDLFQILGYDVVLTPLYAPQCTGQHCPTGSSPFDPEVPCDVNTDPSCGGNPKPTPTPSDDKGGFDDTVFYSILGAVLGILAVLFLSIMVFCCCCTLKKINESQEVQELEMV